MESVVGDCGINPFNSPLETGFRTLVILDLAYPKSYDLSTLVLFDHLIVHSADVNGPPSLHPDLPQRSGELLVRRSLVRAGLNLMQLKHLIVQEFSDDGFTYSVSDEATTIVEHTRSPYSIRLRERARWLILNYGEMSKNELHHLTIEQLDRWKAEFQSLYDSTGTK